MARIVSGIQVAAKGMGGFMQTFPNRIAQGFEMTSETDMVGNTRPSILTSQNSIRGCWGANMASEDSSLRSE